MLCEPVRLGLSALIQDIRTNPPPGWGGRYFTFVKLTTDNGISGIGEVYCATFGPKAMTAINDAATKGDRMLKKVIASRH